MPARGLAEDIVPAYGDATPFDSPVVGVVASPKYPPDAIRASLGKGLASLDGSALWVVYGSRFKDPGKRSQDGNAVVEDFLRSEGADVILFEPNRDYWGDLARDCRDHELVRCCSKVVVFHDGSHTTEGFVRAQRFYPHVTVIEP